MLNTPKHEDNDILERLRHPEREAERKKMNNNLVLRNVLNSIFVLLAIIAMIGIVVSDKDGSLMTWYALGLFAVVIKMIEVVLRMPGLRK